MSFRKYKADVLALLVVLVLSFAVRLPYINYPPTEVGDETLFVDFALNTSLGEPFFEPGYPLGWYIFSLPALSMTGEQLAQTPFGNYMGVPFGPFPYVADRLISAVAGSLVVVLLYLLARFLLLTPLESLFVSFLAVVDSALIVHSRVIMPDSLLLFFGLSGLLISFVSVRAEGTLRRFLLIILSGLLLGFCISVKWVGAGFLAASLFLLFAKKFYREIIIVVVSSLAAYCFVMVMYFNIFDGGPVNLKAGLWRSGPGTSLVFPGEGKWLDNIKFIAPYTMATFNMHASSTAVSGLKRGTEPYTWLFNDQEFRKPYWFKKPDQYPEILLRANPISWRVASLSMLILSFLFLILLFRKKGSGFSFSEKFLLVAYAVNYVPFLFIESFASTPTFLFHYFPSLIFSFLMIPFVVRRFVTEDRAKIIYVSVAILTLASYLYYLPSIYGF